MINIYLESKNSHTPEYVFVDTFIHSLHIPKEAYRILPVNGKDSLHLARNQFLQNTLEGGINLIIFDADYPATFGGYEQRKRDLLKEVESLGIEAEIFLFPNNKMDGDFERLLEMIARKDLHAKFFDCFRDYELCLGDAYVHPNQKGKMYTYITSMPLSSNKRRKIGSGEWLFNNDSFWDIDSKELKPLNNFLLKYTHSRD